MPVKCGRGSTRRSVPPGHTGIRTVRQPVRNSLVYSLASQGLALQALALQAAASHAAGAQAAGAQAAAPQAAGAQAAAPQAAGAQAAAPQAAGAQAAAPQAAGAHALAPQAPHAPHALQPWAVQVAGLHLAGAHWLAKAGAAAVVTARPPATIRRRAKETGLVMINTLSKTIQGWWDQLSPKRLPVGVLAQDTSPLVMKPAIFLSQRC